MTSIMWFRRDLRLRDNPALRAAAADGPVLGLFVLDPVLWRSAGPSRRAWLAANLRSLDDSMDGRLCVRIGDPTSLVPSLAREVGAERVHVTNDSNPYARRRDTAVVAALPDGVEGVATGTPYAVPPGTVKNGSGSPYKVFTPFWRACLTFRTPRTPLPAPVSLRGPQLASDELGDWGLLPTAPDWAQGLRETWTPGEAGAHARLDEGGVVGKLVLVVREEQDVHTEDS